MMKNSVYAVKTAILASGLALAGGCATIEQLEEVRAMVENTDASQAKAAADAAAACCSENSSRLDRMFKRSQMK